MIDEKKLIEEMWNNFNLYYNDANRFNEEETKMADRVLGGVQCMIESQPKVGEWIPVSERLPDVGVYVIVSTKNVAVFGDVKFNYENIRKTEPNFFFDEREDDFEFVDEYEVIAWMPLPEPYKEGLK